MEGFSLFLELARWHPTLRLTVLEFCIIIVWLRSQNILDSLRTKSSWKNLADATPPLPCFYPHSEWGRLRARCKLGFDLIPRSITAVMNLGLLGLPSMARSW